MDGAGRGVERDRGRRRHEREGGRPSRGPAGGGGPGVPRHRLEPGRAVALGLLRADAVGQAQLVESSRTEERDVAKRAVAGHDERRDPLLPGEPKPLGPEALEQAVARSVRRRRCRSAPRGRPARAGGRTLAPRSRASGGRSRRAGRSPLITARPSSVRTATGRSAPLKLTHPAVTQRRSRVDQPALRMLPEVAEGRHSRESGPLEARIGVAVDQLHRRLQPEAPVHAGDPGERLADDQGDWSGAMAALGPASARHTSQRPQPWSASASSPK